jgi:hypothetical protein
MAKNKDVNYDGFEDFMNTGGIHPDDAAAAGLEVDGDGQPQDEVAADEFDDDELAADDETQDDDGQVEVTIKGRKLQTTPEVAAAIKDWRREIRARDGRLGGENAQLRERLARLEGAVEAQQTAPTTHQMPELKPPPPELLVENPAEWQRQLTTYMAGVQSLDRQELVERYETDREQERESARLQAEGVQWAQGFYAEYPEFNKPGVRAIVSNLYTSNEDAILASGNAEDQYDALAEMTKDTLEESFGARDRSRKSTKNQPPNLEGASSPGRKPTKEEPAAPVSLTAATRRRAAQVIEGRGPRQE